MTERLDYLVSLGINAIELLPVQVNVSPCWKEVSLLTHCVLSVQLSAELASTRQDLAWHEVVVGGVKIATRR
jgi:glycosidase